MMHKNIDPKDFEGKTIQKLIADAINVITFWFTDGTRMSIETEGFGGGLTGMVACSSCGRPDRPDWAAKSNETECGVSASPDGVRCCRPLGHRGSNGKRNDHLSFDGTVIKAHPDYRR